MGLVQQIDAILIRELPIGLVDDHDGAASQAANYRVDRVAVKRIARRIIGRTKKYSPGIGVDQTQ